MAVTGSGTQADPYIVDTWEDFLWAAKYQGAYVEFPKQLSLTTDTEVVEGKLYVNNNGEVIINPVVSGLGSYYENDFYLDANDYAPEGFTSAIDFECNLNGRGAKIKNIYIPAVFTGLFQGPAPSIEGVNFENILIEATGTSIFRDCIVERSIISIGAKTSFYLFYASARAPQLNKSAVYIKCYPSLTGQIYLGYGGAYSAAFDRFILDMPNEQNVQLYLHNAHDCLIQGNFNNYQGSYIFLQNSKYMVADCEDAYVTAGSGLAGICIANLGKVKGVMGGVTGVPEDKMTDVNYLDSIGFPIQL